MLQFLFLDSDLNLVAYAETDYTDTCTEDTVDISVSASVLRDGSVDAVFVFMQGVLARIVNPEKVTSLPFLKEGGTVTYSGTVHLKDVRKVLGHLKDKSSGPYKISNDRTTMVSTDIEWLPLSTAPFGAKVWALTTGHIGLATTLTRDTLKNYLGWYPVPKEPSWVKGKGLGYPTDS